MVVANFWLRLAGGFVESESAPSNLMDAPNILSFGRVRIANCLSVVSKSCTRNLGTVTKRLRFARVIAPYENVRIECIGNCFGLRRQNSPYEHNWVFGTSYLLSDTYNQYERSPQKSHESMRDGDDLDCRTTFVRAASSVRAGQV